MQQPCPFPPSIMTMDDVATTNATQQSLARETTSKLSSSSAPPWRRVMEMEMELFRNRCLLNNHRVVTK